MSTLAFTSFVGCNSDIAPPLLPQSYATEGVNCFTDQGALNTWKALNQVGAGTWNTKTGTITSTFLIDNVRWLAWTGAKVDSALMQLASNADWYTVFTGTDKPRYTSRLLAVSGGGTTYPQVSFPLGIPAPTLTLVATVTAKATPANSIKINWAISGTTVDTSNRIARSYIYTYVNDLGQEGPPVGTSNIVYTNNDEDIVLTCALTVPQADINKARIYTSGSGGTYNFLKEIALPQTSVTITNNTIGTAITTTLYSAPPTTMIGVVSMANGMLAAYEGNNLHFSEPYQSHAWPEDYKKAMDYPITGLAAIGNMLFIMTEGYPVIATGNSPAFMSFTKLGAIQACVSTRSIVNMGNGAIYASKDGLVLLSGGKAVMITDGIISERVYQAMVPSSIHGYFYRDKYVGFYDSGVTATGTITTNTGEYIPERGGFIVDIARKTVTYTDQTCTAAFSDKVTGKLYMVQNNAGTNNLYEWNEGSTALSYTWRSKAILTNPTSYAIARVDAASYPVTFELYGDDTLRHTQYVASKEAFRLPAGFMSRRWAIRILGTARVEGVFLANAAVELSR